MITAAFEVATSNPTRNALSEVSIKDGNPDIGGELREVGGVSDRHYRSGHREAVTECQTVHTFPSLNIALLHARWRVLTVGRSVGQCDAEFRPGVELSPEFVRVFLSLSESLTSRSSSVIWPFVALRHSRPARSSAPTHDKNCIPILRFRSPY
jgi:hypothetical protein